LSYRQHSLTIRGNDGQRRPSRRLRLSRRCDMRMASLRGASKGLVHCPQGHMPSNKFRVYLLPELLLQSEDLFVALSVNFKATTWCTPATLIILPTFNETTVGVTRRIFPHTKENGNSVFSSLSTTSTPARLSTLMEVPSLCLPPLFSLDFRCCTTHQTLEEEGD
jgi:hypothetical protein